MRLRKIITALAVTAAAAICAFGFSASADDSASGLTAAELFSETSSDWGYRDLAKRSNGAARQQLYKDILKEYQELWESSETIDTLYSFSSGDYYYYSSIDIDKYGLTKQEACEVFVIVRYDNPMLYLMDSSPLVGSSTIWLTVPKDYLAGEDRAEIQQKLCSRLDEIRAAGEWCSSDFTIALFVNGWLTENMDYAYEYSKDSEGNIQMFPSTATGAHDVTGALVEGKGVCEAYAKAAQAMINYLGGDCIFAVGKGNGENHAWNVVRMDDGNYYYLDVTWNDTADTSNYFAKGSGEFCVSHAARSSSSTGIHFVYDLPEVPEEDYRHAEAGDFTFVVDKGEAVITGYTGTDVEVTVPAEIMGFPVTGIGSRAFYNNQTLKKVTLPDTVVKLNDAAFAFCLSLESAELGSGLRTIGNDAFFACMKLKNISLPLGLRTIGRGAFFHSLYDFVKVGTKNNPIEIPISVTEIGDYAFGYQGSGTYNYDGNYPARNKIAYFAIKGCEGSAAETYASDNGFIFVKTTHSHTFTDTTVLPTFDDEGYDLHICPCGYQYTDNFVPALAVENDLNGDGVFDISDVELFRDYIVGADIQLDQKIADLDNDECITLRDYALFRRAFRDRNAA